MIPSQNIKFNNITNSSLDGRGRVGEYTRATDDDLVGDGKHL